MDTPDSGLYTLAEAAAQLGIATQTLRIQAKSGRIRAFKIADIWLVTGDAIAEYRDRSLGRPFGRVKAAPEIAE